MLARPTQQKIRRRGARRTQLWPNTGIIRDNGPIRQAGPVAPDLGVERLGARWVDLVVQRVRAKWQAAVGLVWLEPFDIWTEPASPGEIDRCVHAQAASLRKRVDQAREWRRTPTWRTA
eukprot:scaffold14371_cov115-Isochrysis_galbana.AAC.2